jgi:hypothetical protein
MWAQSGYGTGAAHLSAWLDAVSTAAGDRWSAAALAVVLRACDNRRRTCSVAYTRAQWMETLGRDKCHIMSCPLSCSCKQAPTVGDGCKSRQPHRQMHWRRRCQMASPLLPRSDLSLFTLSLFLLRLPNLGKAGETWPFSSQPLAHRIENPYTASIKLPGQPIY